MNNIPHTRHNDAKEEIRSRIDIARVVGRYVKLKPAGQNLKGLCPFHKEKTPSFTVNPAREVYHCFGCGKGGDVFSFLMEKEGLTFPEALERLADEAGVTLRPAVQTTAGEKTNTIPRAEALSIHAFAAAYYYARMKKCDAAIDYLKSRGLRPETVREFRLGYAPRGWSNLVDHARAHTIAPEKLVACGLAVSSSPESAPYDRFRDRIIFPIFDLSHRIIAFGGRSMDGETQPKYLNSPETALYHKNRVLYGLCHARTAVAEAGFAIFVEGYMDFLSLYQAGVTNVVAASGTALTEEHGRLIRRFTSKIVLVFDGDDAGLNAAERAVFMLAAESIDTRVFILPPGEDPDTYVRQHGAESFRDRIGGAHGALQFLISRALARHEPGAASAKPQVIDRIMPFIQSTADPILQAEYIKTAAETLDIREPLVYARLPRKNTAADTDPSPVADSAAARLLETLEGGFIHLLVKKPALVETAKKYLSAETFSDSVIKNLFSVIIRAHEEDASLGRLVEFADTPEMQQLVSLMLVKEPVSDNIEEDIAHRARRILANILHARMHDITRRISAEKNPEVKERLLSRQQTLISQRRDLVNRW